MLNEFKICPKCNINKPITSFRKRRNKCINCINIIRNKLHKRKMYIEKCILNESLCAEDLLKENKRLWYLDNKDQILENYKIKYLNSRINRLNNSKNNYYNKTKFFANLIRSTKARSVKNNFNFDLDKDFIEQLFIKQSGLCAVSKLKFVFEKDNNFKRRPFAPSLDRIDPSKGYIKSNIRFVCVIVNLALNEFGDKSFDLMCRSYVKNNICSIK